MSRVATLHPDRQQLQERSSDDPIVLFQTWFQEAFASGMKEPSAMTVATVDADFFVVSRNDEGLPEICLHGAARIRSVHVLWPNEKKISDRWRERAESAMEVFS